MTHVHFMGIGGTGVSGLALMAIHKGYEVSGCDLKTSPYLKMVEENGVPCFTEHSAEHLESVDIVVHSTAVSPDNPELKSAREKEIDVFSRGEFLWELVKDDETVGISGSHGKTTTTWMLYHIFRRTGNKASIYAGGKSSHISAQCSEGPWIIELDESDGSVFKAFPDILLINNLEMEHPDFYADEHDLKIKFKNYINKWIEDDRRLIIGSEYSTGSELVDFYDSKTFPSSREIMSRASFSTKEGVEFIYQGNELFMITDYGEFFVGNIIQPPYMLQNKCAAVLAFHEYFVRKEGRVPSIPSDIWTDLPGIERRFHKEGIYRGVSLISDYAHHPSELKVILDRALNENMNFGIVFQPHRISRFRTFFEDFEEVLRNMDPVIILPTFSAGEKIDLDPASKLAERLQNFCENVMFMPSVDYAVDYFRKNISSFKINTLIFAGAGDIDKIYRRLLKDEI
ncbi:MAG: Mur ligase domain-containing protein [bacterium]